MKKRLLLALSAMFAVVVTALAQPKYVFYFIGDGMGTSQVLLTEMYRAAEKGELGLEPLLMSGFPVASFASHYSASSDVTDSAASATALSSGVKTTNYYVGLDPDGNPVTTMAEMARRSGRKVAIMTTVALNHATPAGFSAHQLQRNMYYKIAKDQIAEGFDFYAGSTIYDTEKLEDGTPVPDIMPQFAEAGYTLFGNVEDFKAGYKDAQKVLMIPEEGKSVSFRLDTYAHPQDHLYLKDMVESAITFLMKDGGKKGFFMMAEGGKIDGACHSHDAASSVHETIDFDEAIAVAFDFYKKHPKQTLIVITADHETGGMICQPKKAAQLAALGLQKASIGTISSNFKKLLAAHNAKDELMSWEEVKDFLTENFGLWGELKVDWDEEKELRDCYYDTVAKRKAGSAKDLYADNAKIVSVAMKIFNRKCGINWVSSHSSSFVPVFAAGVGAEKFTHRTDNAEIAKTIISIAQYK